MTTYRTWLSIVAIGVGAFNIGIGAQRYADIVERGEHAKPIRSNIADCPPYTLRQGRDWPQARDEPLARLMALPWTLPFALAELGAALAANAMQAAEMVMTRRMR